MNRHPHFERVGTTPHRHESEALDWLAAALPSYGPFGGFALFSFQQDDGRRYEIDALAMTAQAAYVIALRPWTGNLVEGDARHLVTSSSARDREVVDHPLPLLATKTRALAERIHRVARLLGPEVAERLAPVRFEPLVWLTHAEGTPLDKHEPALAHVILGRQALGDALRQGRYPGAPPERDEPPSTHETQKALRQVLRAQAFEIGRIDKPLTVLDGRFALGELVEEGFDYQDHWASPRGGGPRCRVRSYLAPRSDRAYVQRLEQRVAREAAILTRLGDHPGVLALTQLDAGGPLGPALVFHGFAGQALDAFLKEHRREGGRSDLSLDDKLALLGRIAEALAFCHRADVVHGALSPEAVLVLRAEKRFDVKLTRFALAGAGEPASEGTRLFTRLAGASANLYEAPDVALGDRPTQASDIFSLGALAYFLLAEEPPATSTADLAHRLARDGGLVISAVRDDLFPRGIPAEYGVDEILRTATAPDPEVRSSAFGSPLDLIYALQQALAAPEAAIPLAEPPREEVDPLHAEKGAPLAGGFRVLGVLGTGATARVLKVAREGEDPLALKIPLSDPHDARIAREGEILARLNRTVGIDRVARLVEVRPFNGRTCLLVQLAGDRTLAEEIRAEGPLSLDYARRWGDDLLTAVRSLEEAGIQHRDIKPANIGLTSGAEKGKKRLLLFDFSLSSRPPTEVGTGTPAYRDPELSARGRWDDAADRWAVAITLHEMFTGVRPAPIPGAAAGSVAVHLDPDRFDADVRDGLLGFFQRAFRASAAQRFATAEDMRDAFIEALHKVPEHEAAPAEEQRIQDAHLQGLGAEARVDLLPLSARERNALDRMGIYTLHDLSGLSRNRIGGVRGVGAKTARALVDLAERVRRHLEASESEAPAPFLRGFAGARRPVEEGLGPFLAYRLSDAGLADSVAVASAPERQVKNLIARARKDGAIEKPADVLSWLAQLVDAERAPTTLGAAAELLAPAKGRGGAASLRRVRQYLGLDEAPGHRRFGSMLELAQALGKTRALISIDVGKARERWLGDGQVALGGAAGSPPREIVVLGRVFQALSAALDAGAGVIPLARAAAAVLATFPPEPDLGPEVATRAAEALVRAVTEVDAHHLGGPPGARLRVRAPRAGQADALLAWRRDGHALADLLGEAADALVADGSVIAEPAAAARLRETLLADRTLPPDFAEQARGLPDRALVTLAVAAAERARLSVRGELYPAGLPADRAVLLSAAAIHGRIDPEELARRVRARYPEAEALAADPAVLERLAARLGLRFDAAAHVLVPRERTQHTGGTEIGGSRSQSTEPPAQAPANAAQAAGQPAYMTRARSDADVAGASETRVFDEELERACREGAFRVLLWRGERAGGGRSLGRGAPNADVVARAVGRRIGADVRAADALLIDSAAAIAAHKKLKGGLAPALQADARGPDGPAWPRLLELMRLAAAAMVEGILAAPRPVALMRLGLLARYELLSTVGDLAIAHRTSETRPATFIVLPVFVGEGAVVEVAADVAPRVGASAGTCLVPVPGVLQHEILEVPSAWAARHAERHASGTMAAVSG